MNRRTIVKALKIYGFFLTLPGAAVHEAGHFFAAAAINKELPKLDLDIPEASFTWWAPRHPVQAAIYLAPVPLGLVSAALIYNFLPPSLLRLYLLIVLAVAYVPHPGDLRGAYKCLTRSRAAGRTVVGGQG